MKILTADHWAHEQIVGAFLQEQCPELLKGQVQELLTAQDWEALDALMSPFYDVE
jgi:hypothetical protein